MSYENPGIFQEPKKVFVNFLILKINEIEERIFLLSRPLSAIEPLQGLINSLSAESMKELHQQYEDLESFEANVKLCSSAKIKQIYRDVLAFLHATYLKEMQFARPKHPSENISVPNVSKKKEKTDAFSLKKPIFK